MFSLEKTRLMSLMYMNISKAGAERIVAEFLVVLSNRIWINGHKQKYKKFHLNMKKNFMLRLAEQWNRLPREIMAPSLEPFQTHLTMVLCHLLQVILSWQGGRTASSPEVPFKLNSSVVL